MHLYYNKILLFYCLTAKKPKPCMVSAFAPFITNFKNIVLDYRPTSRTGMPVCTNIPMIYEPEKDAVGKLAVTEIKAAVDKMALFDRHDRRFEAPSQYTVQEEYQQPLRSGIAVTHCFSSFQRRVSSCGGISIFYLIF